MEKEFKLIALGDTHGRDNWKQIINNEKTFDKLVFIGDYFDTHYDVSVDQQIKNFNDILNFKKKYPNKVILILGNHDFSLFKWY